MMRLKLVERWYKPMQGVMVVLIPFAWVFQIIVKVRCFFYRVGVFKTKHFNCPIIVVGNITVGGTGKTPVVIKLVQFLEREGYRPAVISRGYGTKSIKIPQVVTRMSDPTHVGDEPVMMACHLDCPIVVCSRRVDAAQYILDHFGCDIIISDDGLQHYSLARDLEIVVLDGQRLLGNGYMLPIGPLREPLLRLEEVDFLLINGKPQKTPTTPAAFYIDLVPEKVVSVSRGERSVSFSEFYGQQMHAIAGIGHQNRFFDMLKDLKLNIIEHPFPDHHHYYVRDICFEDDLPVLMTEKDAVKCRSFADDRHWFVKVEVRWDHEFETALQKRLSQLHLKKESLL